MLVRKNDTALFVAGDSNIFFPALVALTSISKHNPGKFDFFMCFEKEHLTPRMQVLLDLHEIRFIDSTSLGIMDEIRAMKKMPGWWPLEVYLNWAMPEYFGDSGYKYAIKVDYDILCIAPYEELTKHLAKNQPFTAISTGGPTNGVNKYTADKILSTMSLSSEQAKAINVGFVLFDIQVCVETNFFVTFRTLHDIISQQEPRIPLDEQEVASILMHQMSNDTAEYLPERYNMRVRRSPTTNNDFIPNIANIHYITRYKPWKPLNAADVRGLGKTFHPIVPMYRNLWIRYAQSLAFCDSFLTEKPLDELQLIGVVSNGTKGIHNGIKEMKVKST